MSREYTVGELRLALTGGLDADTVAEACARAVEAERATAEHEASWRAYQAYLTGREQRRSAEIGQAAKFASERVQRRGGSPGERSSARIEARSQEFAAFEQREPLIDDFERWKSLGSPAMYRPSVVTRGVQAAKGLVT